MQLAAHEAMWQRETEKTWRSAKLSTHADDNEHAAGNGKVGDRGEGRESVSRGAQSRLGRHKQEAQLGKETETRQELQIIAAVLLSLSRAHIDALSLCPHLSVCSKAPSSAALTRCSLSLSLSFGERAAMQSQAFVV